ncbi:MAG: hypothetical protein ACYTDT_07720 [Planctomycetota bacterium]|jgi:hypothetical protein
MKKLLIALALMAPAFGLIGCQDNTELENQVAALRSDVKSLKAQAGEGETDAEGNPTSTHNFDADALAIRLEKAEKQLNDANARIAELESRPATGETVSNKADSTDVTADPEFDAKLEGALARRDEKRRAERDAARAERMNDIAKIAEENGIDFDKDNPRKSMMEIMGNPEKRAKAFEVMRGEMNKRRLASLELSEQQTEDVLRIEKETREKINETRAAARERGATPEEIAADLKYIQEDKDREMQGVLDQEQYDKYKEEAEGGSQMPDNMEDIAKMIPPGMIPGMGGMGGGRDQ